ncbi:MAG: GNAT family N-acetyltransferase [Clostridiales bacterium]|nr:GNAT family N-acetyltransferase [Clostridiales bacterium]
MTEAVKYAFDELNIDVLSIYHRPANIRSQRVIEKCGFKYEGILRQANKVYDGQIFDDVCYSMLKPEYYI